MESVMDALEPVAEPMCEERSSGDTFEPADEQVGEGEGTEIEHQPGLERSHSEAASGIENDEAIAFLPTASSTSSIAASVETGVHENNEKRLPADEKQGDETSQLDDSGCSETDEDKNDEEQDLSSDDETAETSTAIDAALATPRKATFLRKRKSAASSNAKATIAKSKKKPRSAISKVWTKKRRRVAARLLSRILLHTLCCAVYLIPVLLPSEHNRGSAVLDEMHIMDVSVHQDIHGTNKNWTAMLLDVFTNDYWGRSMYSPSSHKSWRPLSILSFRYLQVPGQPHSLVLHRIVNVVTHAAVAELVSLLALQLLHPFLSRWIHTSATKERLQTARSLLKTTTKLWFALHPTHVEVTANAANRPHLLALLCSLLLSDPTLPWPLFFIALISGYLSCETFLFQAVPAAATLAAITYVRYQHYEESTSASSSSSSSKKRSKSQPSIKPRDLIIAISPRCFALFGSGVVYFAARYAADTLSIPEGLIRPAENPFFTFTGQHRIRNYFYVTAIHIAKSWDWDFVGFSHEYGRACIRPITSWHDPRLWIPTGMVLALAWTFLILLWYQLVFYVRHHRERFRENLPPRQFLLSTPLILLLVHTSWMLTLFPITGIVKVGTFIADRLVVASTVSSSMIVGVISTCWVMHDPTLLSASFPESKKKRNAPSAVSESEIRASITALSKSWFDRLFVPFRIKILVLMFIGSLMWYTVHQRTLEWMDSVPLLESSLRTCPRFAKAHLEVSKIYSGLYPDRLNLTKSFHHIQLAESLDPEYCDVHFQFAHVYIQQGRNLAFEERLTQALLCPFSAGGAESLWQRYWQLALDPARQPPAVVAAAKERYQKQWSIVQDAIVKASAGHDTKTGRQDNATTKQKSPLIGWK